MKSAKTKRQLTLVTLVLALGVAVYLNWEYAKSDTSLLQPQDLAVNAPASSIALPTGTSVSGVVAEAMGATSDVAATDADISAATAAAANTATENASVQEALPDKNYGDAQLVSAGTGSTDKYFEQARLTREKTRDEALDKLQKSLKNTNLGQEEKDTLTQSLTSVIAGITSESDIENLVKAKGFVDCVAFIDGEKISVAIKTAAGTLEPAQVAQIRDIVLAKLETDAKNITVVEVK